jgi:hypothetical protein
MHSARQQGRRALKSAGATAKIRTIAPASRITVAQAEREILGGERRGVLLADTDRAFT